ncbi:similar to Saccharomyces cerevisiae YBR276C PPS1 Protein phosphatase with specificity for serine, threonine, and tyrosine residues [Maudiozyma barnettii]|uniref:Similar to Saccharomyces cerevisiae YBR276C PPS1 Protein phosphatase with specificity for serine, threonine, and tyrosine residues n=1 Tax=Maudiozyma barnettii TaxID=61262 RepID=A0A8H2ZJU2_9SACH|nr:tyrosine/serine/threonine protein phosphatase PPS1 [Kazachstania barnettii]CAB4254557.1 similar to Saccharomyces cerevisiae YBR276C PPS1 Protein phosphatase with specificity for serine, threonine, and tyrosine residues [Kazachstania barnettii]CAD1782599.1 similar to Saccharomyces cerevisiae YBR276C PPS1 Protein phosphatase with specificity for serine, threonine, and tyrosine residues [Kazachstania barnettii]
MLSSILDVQEGAISMKPSEVDLRNDLDREVNKRMFDSTDILQYNNEPIRFTTPNELQGWIESDTTTVIPPYDLLFPWLHSYSKDCPPRGVGRTMIIRSRQIVDFETLEDSGILKNSVEPHDIFVAWSDSINHNLLKFYSKNYSILENLTTIKDFLHEILNWILKRLDIHLSDIQNNKIIKLCIHFKILPFLKTDFESIKEFCGSNRDKVGITSSLNTDKSSDALWKQYTNSFRRFDLQCTKILELSSRVVLYCLNENNHHEHDSCEYCIHFKKLLILSMTLLNKKEMTPYCNDNIYILKHSGFNTIPNSLIGTPPLNNTMKRGGENPELGGTITSPYDAILFNNWDRAFKIHEKLEMAKLTSRSCIDLEHSFWCGNTTDFRIIKFFNSNDNIYNGKSFKLEDNKKYPYYSPNNSILTLPSIDLTTVIHNNGEGNRINLNEVDTLNLEKNLFNIPFVECQEKKNVDKNLFIRCSENAALLTTEQLWDILCQTLDVTMGPQQDIMFSFPSSGSIGLGSLNMSSIGNILNTCYFMYIISRRTDYKALLHCRDGYTELTFLLVTYLLFLWDIPLEEVIIKLNTDCERPFYLFQTDIQVLNHLQLLIRSFSPKRKDNFERYNSCPNDDLPEPLEIDSEMFSNIFFTKLSETNINLNKLNGPLPSRILDHLYLGSLEHAQSPELLKRLGITHIVSVGEIISWVKPSQASTTSDVRNRGMSTTHNVHVMKSNVREQRSATITTGDTSQLSSTSIHQFVQDDFNILKINNLQDNGFDCITDQLEEILKFIDVAYNEGGKVLVHCMVGVSRSATVCIAECMKRFRCEVLRAYLYVRVRRLNIIIQPNLIFMYDLLRWQEALGITREMDWHIICRNILELNKRYV